MRGVSSALRRTAVFLAFVAAILTSSVAVYADDGGIYDPPGNRIGPPIGIAEPATGNRVRPPIGVTSNGANIYEPPAGRIGPPLPTTRERMTLAGRFWTWLQSRIGSPSGLN